MTGILQSILPIDITSVDIKLFKRSYASCIVKTHDNKILLQELIDSRPYFPAGSISTFGGHIEMRETPSQALIRELKEELGAEVSVKETIFLGAIAEAITGYSELIYTYFWHDKDHKITGCYEDKPKYFDSIKDAFAHDKLGDDVRWMLGECQKRELL